MRILFLDVPDAQCGACRAAVLAALEPLRGVIAADVDVRRGIATVTYDERRVTTAAVVDALTAAGYAPS